MCNIVPGDRVQSVGEEHSLCPNEHPADEWDTSEELGPTVFRVEDVFAEEDGCVCLRLEGRPETVWCWGPFRKIEPGNLSVKELFALGKPAPALTPEPV